MTSNVQVDLSTVEGVRAYTANTPFASTEIASLSGGIVNYVFRLTLVNPYEGCKTLVFKHAKPYAKKWDGKALTQGRQVYEVEALRRVRSWIPPDAIVTVPRVHLFDESFHAIIMDDVGPSSINLNEFMKQGGPSLEMAAQIGQGIGEFLGTLHKWGKDNPDVCEFFAGNTQAKALCAWIFYGRLMDTLTLKGEVLPKLRDPPLEVSKADLEIVQQLAEETGKAIIDARDTIVMGDFWPRNIMVTLDEKGELKRMYVIDWEFCRPGLLGVEIGHFCGEMHLLRRCHEAVCKETASLVLDNFFERYKRLCPPDESVCKRAIVHWGADMVILAPRVAWGNKEMTREVVLEGVAMMVHKGDFGSSPIDLTYQPDIALPNKTLLATSITSVDETLAIACN